MELLKKRILEEGTVVSDQVLLLDAILTHQVDPELTMEMGRAFADKFKDDGVTRIVTLESSGIAVAFATANELKVPMVFARRKRTLLADPDVLVERVPSFTKGIVTDILLSRQFISPSDRILFIDDIIANGDAARGLVRLVERSGAQLIGAGIVVEKTFQPGANALREQGIRLESLVKIKSLENGQVHFSE
ncbi:xanthine phosphoribosyltransferase [Paenibacillus sp. CAA11]|uniref:xanthine phosphoribosyltransferase n=1 Tax=Paenibacillus sp. CAA11 TaxID=1532905 RepID=UPI000D35DAE1|nr:xanthine phosphoribosyltransferase [Paenibacillus sp. CAA11]AWB44182.1 xanthine phosphoribosyltransferase [Paenibacillus sp. CAA11]